MSSGLRVYYDGLIFSLKNLGGINQYFQSLISLLPEEIEASLSTTRGADHAGFCGSRADLGKLEIHEFKRFGFWPGRLSFWLEQHYFRQVENQSHANVYHPTFYRTLTRRALNEVKLPIVLTVWDFLHERYPNELDPKGDWKLMIDQALKAADALICISHTTRSDLLHRFPELESRARVIPLASKFAPESPRTFVERSAYLLFVGGRAGYKNFRIVVETLSNLKAPLRLKVAGSPWSQEELELLNQHRILERVDLIQNPEDAVLKELYRGALALIYPSLFEGFGLPVLESMSLGTPVLAADTPALKEVAGDAALFFPPADESALIDLVEGLLSDVTRYEDLCRQGQAHAGRYSWEKLAVQTAELYQEVSR